MSKRLVVNELKIFLQILLCAIKELLLLALRRREREELHCCHPSDFPGRNENHGLGTFLHNFVVRGPHHTLQPTFVEGGIKAQQLHLQGDGASTVMKVERGVALCPYPFADVARVRNGGSQSNYAQRILCLLADVPHPRSYHFDAGADWTCHQMNAVNNEQVDCLHTLPVPPASRDHVPVLRSGQYDVAPLKDFQVESRFPRQSHHSGAKG
mmetsp:Transcript_14509/g.41345  ORF Transcript_14509/g.41345 Transcript_14509/m.41345 type:complete len:211 (-) Transcript_14509:90-722(-)